MNSFVAGDVIQKRIVLLRGQKVMLSTDLAELYDVEARALVQAVKRNHDRFPADFMFQLSETEFADLKSQIVTSSHPGRSGTVTPFKITIRDLETRAQYQVSALCFYRAWSHHGCQRAEQLMRRAAIFGEKCRIIREEML